MILMRSSDQKLSDFSGKKKKDMKNIKQTFAVFIGFGVYKQGRALFRKLILSN